jgi:hypothetical protein
MPAPAEHRGDGPQDACGAQICAYHREGGVAGAPVRFPARRGVPELTLGGGGGEEARA